MLMHCSYFINFSNVLPSLSLVHICVLDRTDFTGGVYSLRLLPTPFLRASNCNFCVCKYMDCRSCFLPATVSANSTTALGNPQYPRYIQTDYCRNNYTLQETTFICQDTQDMQTLRIKLLCGGHLNCCTRSCSLVTVPSPMTRLHTGVSN